MQTVSQLLANKKHWNDGDHGHHRIERVHTINQSASALDAARLMNEHHVGSLIVTDSSNTITGIITERDILTRIVTAQLDPATTTVSKAMTKDVISCTPETSLTEARHLMTDCKIRHIPVTETKDGNNQLVGMISIGDLNAASNADLTIEVKTMRQYITAS
ncbi:MAG: CBS domain-containing protein [Phycisphaerales bacterium]|nr:CBS domain-containing protein [Phycisphaerales bacterium]